MAIIDIRKLELYLDNSFNVLFTGDHGVGKTSMIFDLFNRKGINFRYFSGATLDPWVDFVGIPQNMDGVLDMVVPRWISEDVEVVFMDELNRTHKKVRNALMEAIQFKSINSRPLGKLRCVWAAINPDKTDAYNYDVEPLDDAQRDRFEIHMNVPFTVDEDYFVEKYGEIGEKACHWWFEISKTHQKMVSPRRLEYALKVWSANGDMKDVLPEQTNVGKLISDLSRNSILPEIKRAIKERNTAKLQTIMGDANNFNIVSRICTQDKDALSVCLPIMGGERAMAYIFDEENDNMKAVCQLYIAGDKGVMQFIEENTNNFGGGEKLNKYNKCLSSCIPQFSYDLINGKPAELPNSSESKNLKEIENVKVEMLQAQGQVERQAVLKKVFSNIGKDDKPTKEQVENLISTINIYCDCSHPATIRDHTKDILVSIYNYCAVKSAEMKYTDSVYRFHFDTFKNNLPLCERMYITTHLEGVVQ